MRSRMSQAPTVEPIAGRFGSTKVTLSRSEEHTSELQSRQYLVCRLLLEKKNQHRPCSILSSIASCVFHYALPSNRFPTTWIAKADQPTPTELLNVMTRGLMLDFPQLERT